MNDRKPGITSVPTDYRPGYPAEVTPQEYRELIEPDQRGRLVGAAAAMGLAAASLSAQGPTPATADREAKVLAVLQQAWSGRSSWRDHATFVPTENEYGTKVIVPHIPISFGNSHNGVFDAGRARTLAAELFGAYGLVAGKPRDAGQAGVAAWLDGFDARAKVGFKLRGDVPEKQEMMGRADPEPAKRDLDVDEHRTLSGDGWRLHVAAVDQFPLMDGDQFTPTLAYLASIVDFLNSVTEGPDIDVMAVLGTRRQVLPLVVEVRGAAAYAHQPGAVEVTIKDRLAIPIRIDKSRKVRLSATGRVPGGAGETMLDAPLPSVGMVTSLTLPVTGDGAATLRLLQEGKTPINVQGKGGFLMLPAGFDVQKPFSLALTIEPGHYVIGTEAIHTAAKGR